jgi:hypothetical protein
MPSASRNSYISGLATPAVLGLQVWLARLGEGDAAQSGATGSLRPLDSLLEEGGFELVWGFPCQVVFFGLLPVLCSEAETGVLHPRRLRSGSLSARNGVKGPKR